MSKRLVFAKVFERMGLTRLFEAAPSSPGIFIFSHHRIGDAERSRFDRQVFGATAEQFAEQLTLLKRRYRLLGLAECQELIAHPSTIRQFFVMLTFDDGFRDNYEVAFPALKSAGVPATFFLSTSLVGSSFVPWWDRIAYMVRGSEQQELRLDYPQDLIVPLQGDREVAITRVLRLFKASPTASTEKFLAQVSQATGVAQPESEQRRFLDWKEAREMQAAGMEFGSHTHSHTILSQLSYAQQVLELQRSKREMETQLEVVVDALAYPVGSRMAFTEETKRALQECGYRTAFSHYYGANTPRAIDPFDVRRSKPSAAMTMFRLHTAIAADFSYDWH